MAYTTYFGERNRYENFIEAGYRIFFVNASFTSLPINSAATGFTPFRIGGWQICGEQTQEWFHHDGNGRFLCKNEQRGQRAAIVQGCITGGINGNRLGDRIHSLTSVRDDGMKATSTPSKSPR